ncbi:lamin tail domain-containing protein [Streptomyces sp. NPDC059680]|uniref:lamin tail domain-containing protein n=1 Tax=Streptomyces TaxID=1883 RepID=UPI001E342B6E|nr:lamin tail domain-containing protein [Streptomyces barringtoniae]MCC5474565.1 lamin tail domain-containing protein [Streptomyces barringtoniae]
MTAVAAVAAAALGAVAWPAAAADHHPGYPWHTAVYISGVQYDAPGRDDRSNRSLNREWVDITNSTRRAVNLEGWTLSDEDGRTYTFRHVWLEGRGTVRVHTGFGRDSHTDVYQDRRREAWENDGDTATLRNDRGRFVDAVSWGRDDDHRGDHRGDDRDHRGDDRDHRGGHRH